MNEGVLAVGGAATVAALLYAPAARWAWALAAIAVGAWATLVSGPSTGAPLIIGVVAATVLERGDAPAIPGFNNMVARIAAAIGAVAAALLIAVRVLLLDLVDSVEAFGMIAIGLAAALYMLTHGGAVEEARAARLALVVAAAAWVAAGHPSAAVSLTAGGLLVLLALAPRGLME